MKFRLLLITLFFLAFKTYAQDNLTLNIIDEQNNGDSIRIDCDYPLDANKKFKLKADYTKIHGTSSYKVESIGYRNFTNLTNEEIIHFVKDDTWSDAVKLPFKFCYYDDVYDSIIIGDNGVASFNIKQALGDSQFKIAKKGLPHQSMFANTIFGAYHDMTNDPNVVGCKGCSYCGEVKTYVRGTAPNRSFIISYEDVNHLNSSKNQSTLQIILYETTNIIEVHIKEKPINDEPKGDLNDFRKNALIGIQDKTTTKATFPPDRNGGIWSATNEAWRFIPDGTLATSVKWTKGVNDDYVDTKDSITVVPKETITYKATVTYDVCVGDPITLVDTVDIIIDQEFPLAIDNEVNVCSATVDLTEYKNLMVGEQKGLNLSYYLNSLDANTAINTITNPTKYQLSKDAQGEYIKKETFYVRLDRGINCFDVGKLIVNLQDVPTAQTTLTTLVDICDDGNDNIENINFPEKYNNFILGQQKGVAISYYTTLADAENVTNTITSIDVANKDKVYVRLELVPTGTCPVIEEIPIKLSPKPVTEDIKAIVCSDTTIYDLTQHEAGVISATASATIISDPVKIYFSYHKNKWSAEHNTNPFDPKKDLKDDPEAYFLNRFDNQGNKYKVEEVWVRCWTKKDNVCFGVFKIEFEYKDGVGLEHEKDMQINKSGTIFDLTESIKNMGVEDDGTISITYYTTEEAAKKQDKNFVIKDPKAYAVSNPESMVYVVFENKETGCQQMGGIGLGAGGNGSGFGGGGDGGFGICDTKNDAKEVIALSQYDASLIQDYEFKEFMTVNYFETSAEAEGNTNSITTYTLTKTTTIYARISLNNAVGVEINHKVVKVKLEFKATASINDEVAVTMCDDLYDNLETGYDLTQWQTSITSDTTASFTYYYNNGDKNQQGKEILTPTSFDVKMPTSGEKKQIIKVVVTLDECDLTASITLEFYPKIKTKKYQKLNSCDGDDDGKASFNLVDALPLLVENSSVYTATYYEIKEEAQSQSTKTISDYENYIIDKDKSIYVRVSDTLGCSKVEKLDLKIISTPSINKTKLYVCDYQNDNKELSVSLTDFDDDILGGQKYHNVKAFYFATETDLINDTSTITQTDVISTTTNGVTKSITTVYVKLQGIDSCTSTGTIDISLQESPRVENAINVVVCDNLEQGEEEYDLRLNEGDIVSGTATGYSFKYFSSEEKALNGSSADIYYPNKYVIKKENVPDTIYVKTKNANGCFSISKMILNLTTPSFSVQNVELTACDEDKDLSEVFDLTLSKTDMLTNTAASFDTSQLTITYYSKEAAAKTGDSTFLIATPKKYQSTSENDIVYARFYNEKTGCFGVGKIILKVLKIPKLLAGEYNICDVDLDGVYTLDLKELNSKVTTTDSEKSDLYYDFYYYTSEADAKSGTNTITTIDNYIVPKDNHVVYIYVKNKESGCFAIAPVTITISKPTNVNVNITDTLESCDDDLDDYSIFDLTLLESKIITQTNATFTYYTSEEDAKQQQSEITEPSKFKNTEPKEQTIYVRVATPDRCDAITSFKISTIHIQDPLLNDVTICKGDSALLDVGNQYSFVLWSTSATTQSIEIPTGGVYSVTLTDGNGCQGTFSVTVTQKELPKVSPYTIIECHKGEFKEFNLTDFTSSLTSNTTSTNTVEFYLTLDDLTLDINKLPTSFTNTENPQTIYAKVTNDSGCVATTTLTFEVLKKPEIKVTQMTICDNENDNEEKDVDLTQFDDVIIDGQTSASISYFATEIDVNNNVNSLTTIDVNGSKTLYVKLTKPNGCSTFGTFQVNLKAAPIVNDVNVVLCDNFKDGQESYDLSLNENDIVSDTTNLTFSYFLSKESAIDSISAISNNYVVDSVPQIIYVRTTSSETGCFSISKINLDFTLPVSVQNTELTACSNDPNLIEEFDLTTAISSMLTDTTQLTVTYYSDEKEAEKGSVTSLINTPKQYTSKNATVYVRFYNEETGCFSIGEIELKVLETPELIDNVSYKICDEDLDGVYSVNLTDLEALIISDTTDLDFIYYTSKSNAEDGVNAISETTNYSLPTNNTNTIYVLVKNKLGCWSIAPVKIEPSESVDVNTVSEVLEECDDDLDGYSIFDLTSLESKITTEANAKFRYYINEDDAKKQQSEITESSHFKNTKPKEQIVYVRVSIPNQCDAITSFKISTVYIKEPILNDVAICKGEPVLLDVGNQYSSVLWSTSATTQSIEVSTGGVYSVTLTDGNGCQGTFSVTVTASELPTASSQSITECYTESFKTFNLDDYNSSLTSDTSNIIEFYLSENDLVAGVNKLDSSFTNTVNPQTIYVKVINDLGCTTSTTLTLTVIKTPEKPKVKTPINYMYGDVADPLTAQADAGNTLLWYNQEFGGVDIGSPPVPSTKVSGSTDYWVSQINSFGCESKRSKITVYVSVAPIVVYNEFSPNDDGYNEYFRIEHIEQYPKNRVEIYNRWGTLVFAIDGYTNDSDKSFRGISNVAGNFLGKELVIGVYFYLIDLNNGLEPKKGWLHINR